MLDRREFGVLPGGDVVQSWTLSGAGGLTVEVLAFGGIVRRILAPDRSGNVADVVLGFNTLGEYVAGHPYFGAITGRVAGRIAGATFRHGAETYALSHNDGVNHLHGGAQGFDRKLWNVTPVPRQDGAPSIMLTASSADGEEGYPGSLNVSVTYTVQPDNAFVIETEAIADRPTPCSLTHHSYFNLAGEASGPTVDHLIQVHADSYVPTDATLTLSGRTQSVAGSGEDLRRETSIESALARQFLRHGALYRLRNVPGEQEPVAAARLVHPASGRVLHVSTDNSYLQLYTGASLDGTLTGKSGVAYDPHHGICLECQGYPDPWNAEGQETNVLNPGELQQLTTTYKFSTLQEHTGEQQ